MKKGLTSILQMRLRVDPKAKEKNNKLKARQITTSHQASSKKENTKNKSLTIVQHIDV